MRRKKLWYVPGLYSLLGLPILLLLFGPEEFQFPNYFTFYIPHDRPTGKWQDKFLTTTILQTARGKKATTIDFWYSPYESKGSFDQDSKLDFIATEIDRLAFVHDSTTFLKIEMGDGINYGELLWILNRIAYAKIDRYALVKNTLYVFPNEIPTDPHIPCEELFRLPYADNDYTYKYFSTAKRLSWWEKSKREILGEINYLYFCIRHGCVVLIGFLLFIVVPFTIRIRKFRKIQLQPRYPLQS